MSAVIIARDRILNCGKAGEAYNIGDNIRLPSLDLIDLLCNVLDDIFKRVP